jgi:3-hydroxybutyryl-CoA dehydratase
MKLTIGESYTRSFLVDDLTIKQFAEVSKDQNPLHLNDTYARKTIFKQRIAHGMLLGGFISSVPG